MEQKTGPKDVFLHILSVVALYVAAGSFIALVFQYINIAIPDPLQIGYNYISNTYDSIRWSISILIVVFPVYVWSVWFLNRGYAAVPERREIRARRWLLYFTLFAAALIIIGDLVTLVYNLLRGEFTSRFLLKVLTILVVAGAVFIYYLWEVRKAGKDGKPLYVKAISYISIVAVAAAIVGGFFIVGSPVEERAYRFDDERIADLRSIENEIFYFYQAKSSLPNNISDLKSDVRGFIPPVDPESDANYVYRKVGNLSFELCANFNRANRSGVTEIPSMAYDPYYAPENWQHEAGQVCFSRTIDPDLLPPIEKPIR